MCKEEFIRRHRAVEREAKTIQTISTVAIFAVFVAAFAFMVWFQRSYGPLTASVGVSMILFIFAGLIGMDLYSRWRTKRRVRQYGLSCVSCHGVLTGNAGSIAIACENCVLCGGKLFTQEDDASPPTLAPESPNTESLSPALECPKTKEEFLLRERTVRRESRPLLVLLVLNAGMAIAARLMLAHAKAHPEEGRLVAILLPVALVGFFAVFFIVTSRLKKRTREYGMACPVCQKPLVGLARQLVTMTGFCCGCGERVLDDVQFETETNAVQRKAFAERQRAARREFRSSIFIFLPIGALGLAVFIVACIFVPSRGDYHGLPFSTLQNGMIAGPVVLLYVGAFLMLWQMKRRRQKYGLICATCRSPLQDGGKVGLQAGKVAVAIGRCVRCGGNALAAEGNE